MGVTFGGDTPPARVVVSYHYATREPRSEGLVK